MMTNTLLRGPKKFGDLHLVKPSLAFTGHQSDIYLTVFRAINDDVVLLAICRERDVSLLIIIMYLSSLKAKVQRKKENNKKK